MQASRRELSSLGVVYTPPEVTAPMVRVALAPLVAGRSADEIAALRICDPATGDGAFLRAAVQLIAGELVARGMAADEARVAAARCVCGVDIDPVAVAAARDVIGAGGDQLLVADALALDWPAAFPAVFARGGFDAVVGNPPYVRQELLGLHKPLLRRFASYDGVADLYVYFVELVHRLVRPGGRYCLITPNKWLTVEYGRALRSYLAERASVEGVVDLGRSTLFDGADAFPCIVWGSVEAAAADVSARADAPSAPSMPIWAARLPAGAPIALDAGVPHARERWGGDPWHIDVPDERALIDRLEARWPRLDEHVRERPARGVVTGCNRAFVIDRATRDRLLCAEPAAAALIHPFVKGRDVRCWLPAEPVRWILLVDRGMSLDELPAAAAHLARYRDALEPRPASPGDATGAWRGRKPGSYRWYELQDPVGPLIKSGAPRLLYQDIQTGPACSFDEGALVPDTTVWMLPTADRFLLAVLNSPLYGWYARRRFPPALNGSVRPKREHICRFPVAAPPADLRAAIEHLVAERLGLARQSRVAPTSEAAPEARRLDQAIASAVHDAYELSAAERTVIEAA